MELRNTKATFPDVSVCTQQGMRSTDQVTEKSEDLNDLSKSLRIKIEYYRNSLNTINPVDETKSFLVTDCKWAKWKKNDGLYALWGQDDKDSRDCNYTSEKKQFLLPGFSECYTFRAKSIGKEKPEENWWQKDDEVRGLSLILYMNTTYSPMPMKRIHYTQSHGRGYKIQIHPRRSIPDMAYALRFSLGFETSIRFNPFVTQFLGPPYRDCSTEEKVKFNGYNIHDYSYSRHFCRASCFQSAFVTACGCLSVEFYATETMLRNYSFCGTVKDNLNLTLQQLNCLERTDTKYCKALCRHPCNRLSYRLESGSEIWPHENFLESFYLHYIEGKPYEKHFNAVKKVLQRINETNETNLDSLYSEILEARNIISMNFAQVNAFVKNNKVRLYKDVPAMTFSTLVSNLGGTFNLWIGISFFTLIELVEIAFRLLCVSENKVKTLNGTK